MQKAISFFVFSLLVSTLWSQNDLEDTRWREAMPQDSTEDGMVYQFHFLKKGELTATRVHYQWVEDQQKWQGVTAEQFCDGRGDSYSIDNRILHIQPREKYVGDKDLYFYYDLKEDTLWLHRAKVYYGNPEGLFGMWNCDVYEEGQPNHIRVSKIELLPDFRLVTHHRPINDTNAVQLLEDRWIETVANRNSKSVCPPETQVTYYRLIGDRLYTHEEKVFAKLIRRPAK